MQYNKFIQSSFQAIRNSRKQYFLCKFIPIQCKIPHDPTNIYIQLLLEKDNQIFKIEQWNFKCQKSLIQSQYQSNNDSQLQQLQIDKKSYFSVLEEKLLKFNQKLLIKTLEPKQAILSMVTSERQLKPFLPGGFYLVGIDDYEGALFKCHISMQIVNSDFNHGAKQSNFDSDEQQFQILVDSEHDRKKIVEAHKVSIEQKKQQGIQKGKERKVHQGQQLEKSNASAEKSMQHENTSIKNQGERGKVEQQQIQKLNILKELQRYLKQSEDTTPEEKKKSQLINQTLHLINALESGGKKLLDFLPPS